MSDTTHKVYKVYNDHGEFITHYGYFDLAVKFVYELASKYVIANGFDKHTICGLTTVENDTYEVIIKSLTGSIVAGWCIQVKEIVDTLP